MYCPLPENRCPAQADAVSSADGDKSVLDPVQGRVGRGPGRHFQNKREVRRTDRLLRARNARLRGGTGDRHRLSRPEADLLNTGLLAAGQALQGSAQPRRKQRRCLPKPLGGVLLMLCRHLVHAPCLWNGVLAHSMRGSGPV